MSKVGTFVVGDGTKVGRDLDAAQQTYFNVVAGASTSYPGRTVPMRVRCAKIWSFDPETWAPLVQLTDATTAGAVRSAQLVEPGFQQETLSFTVLDNTATLAPGDWLCLKWTEAVASSSITLSPAAVFRVASAQRRDRAGLATTLAVNCIDWFQYDASPLDGAGSVAFTTLAGWRDAYLASGLPPFTDGFSFIPSDDDAIGNALGGAILERATAWTGSTKPLRVIAWPTLANTWTVSSDILVPSALDVGQPGQPSTLYDTLRKLWLLVGGFILGYDTNGYLFLMPGGDRAVNSGAYITSESTKLGAIPLPWATPSARDVSQRPEFDAVSYFVRRDEPPDGAEGTGGAFDAGLWHPAQVGSFSAVHPFGTSQRGTEEVVDVIPWFGADINHTWQAMGFESILAWCRYRLRQHLAAADTLTFRVDPAYPPPALGQLVRVHLPPDVDGWFQLVGFTQPLTAQMASWQLRWWNDA